MEAWLQEGYVERRVGQAAGAPDHVAKAGRDPGPTRADAVASRERILDAAAALAGDRGTSMIEIAAAAGVGRSTLYRHFSSRRALEQALGTTVRRLSPAECADCNAPFRPPASWAERGRSPSRSHTFSTRCLPISYPTSW